MNSASDDELAKRERLLRAVFDCALDALLLADDNGIYVEANPAACELFGIARHELVGTRLRDYAAPGYDGKAVWAEFITAGRLRGRFPLRRPDGTMRLLDYSATAHVLPGLHLSVMRDVTEQERAAEELRQSRNLLEQAQAVAHVGSWTSRGLDRSDIQASKECRRIFGLRDDERFDFATFLELVHPEDRSRLGGLGRAARTSQTAVETDYRIIRPDGEVRWLHASGVVELQGPEAVPTLIGVVQDITEQRRAQEARARAEAALKRSEEQLRQAQKLEAIGSLAGGVAHDFNNLLSVVIGYTSLVLEAMPEGARHRADLEEVRLAGEKAVALTRQLLAFSRRQVLKPIVLDLNQVVRGFERMFRRVLGENVQLSLIMQQALGRVAADASQIEQVIMNLVVNAHDAMPHGGKLTIETANRLIDADEAAEHVDLRPGPYVVLRVSDTGDGMDAATRERIFEPFFTTKPKGKGTGLGLSTVFGIVRQSGGQIAVESAKGQGSTFTILLPQVEQPIERASVPLERGRVGGNETVLLVEDDDQVRALTRSVLRRHGYQVLEAQNAGEAVILSEEHPEHIDLLLTDVVMPRISGSALAERLSRTRPSMKVLFMSGYTDDPGELQGLLQRGAAFFAKPVVPEALTRKIREVLDGLG